MKLFPIICVGSVFWKQAQHCSQDFDKKKKEKMKLSFDLSVRCCHNQQVLWAKL